MPSLVTLLVLPCINEWKKKLTTGLSQQPSVKGVLTWAALSLSNHDGQCQSSSSSVVSQDVMFWLQFLSWLYLSCTSSCLWCLWQFVDRLSVLPFDSSAICKAETLQAEGATEVIQELTHCNCFCMCHAISALCCYQKVEMGSRSKDNSMISCSHCNAFH